MRWNRLPGKPRGRVHMGRRTISMPGVPSMTGLDEPTEAIRPTDSADRSSPIDRKSVQYLDRVRAIFRPTNSHAVAPGLERFVGREDIFRHVGTADMGSGRVEPMMQCPSYWPHDATWVQIGDLEILEILEDQDVRAG